MKKGLWLNENTFITFQEKVPAKTLSQEIASRGRSIDFLSPLSLYLPDPDPVLRRTGQDIRVYRELMSDAHVGATVESRKSGVLSLDWELERGLSPKRQYQFVLEVLSGLDLVRIISEILDAPFFGFKPIEVMWQKDGSSLIVEDLVGKPPEWFVFSPEGELRFRSKENMIKGEALPPYKFLLARHKPTYENPYGERVLSRCFWPVTFKRGGMKFWITFTEKYGMPFIVGKHPRPTQKQDIDALLDVLEKMIQDAVAVIPDDASIEIHETDRRASADIYLTLLQFMNMEISKAVLGQTLTTEMQPVGSFAAAKVHLEVRDDIVRADKRIVEQTINTLIKWLVRLNFGEEASIPRFRLYDSRKEVIEQAEQGKKIAERDRILSELGLKFTRKYFQTTYDLSDEDISAPEPEGEPPGSSFKEPSRQSPYPDQKALDELSSLIANDKKRLQLQAEKMLEKIVDMVREGGSYEEVLENLLLLYPEVDSRDFENLLARAIFIADLWGRINGGT